MISQPALAKTVQFKTGNCSAIIKELLETNSQITRYHYPVVGFILISFMKNDKNCIYLKMMT
jgi:hypothetical protein